jgi:hypothetical protein
MSENLLLGSHIVGFSPSMPEESSQTVKTKVNDDDIESPDFKPLHQISNMCLSKGYLVVYGAESARDETAKDRLFGNIENAGALKQSRDSISNGLLTIIDRNRIYEECGKNHEPIVKFWNSSIKKANERPQILSKGTILFSAPDTYLLNKGHDTFILFEDSMGKTFSPNVSMICWYKSKWFNDLSLASLIKVRASHECTIHVSLRYKKWREQEIVNLLSQAIDSELGHDAAPLLFRTMQSAYKLNQKEIVPRPVLFEATLRRMLGSDYADVVIDSIFGQLLSRISFSGDNGFTG